jgi:hypothetical protein
MTRASRSSPQTTAQHEKAAAECPLATAGNAQAAAAFSQTTPRAVSSSMPTSNSTVRQQAGCGCTHKGKSMTPAGKSGAAELVGRAFISVVLSFLYMHIALSF